jgi:hypothetical protein
MRGESSGMDGVPEQSADGEPDAAQVRRRVLLGAVLWPSFIAAGLLEVLTFLMVDPLDVHWLGHDLGLGRTAIYSLVFLMYWAACALSALGGLLVVRSLQP